MNFKVCDRILKLSNSFSTTTGCPFCIRTRILFHLKKIPYEIVEEPLREWTPWMIEWSFANNERSRVPVLRYVLEEGVEKVMPESNEMNLFIDSVDEKMSSLRPPIVPRM